MISNPLRGKKGGGTPSIKLKTEKERKNEEALKNNGKEKAQIKMVETNSYKNNTMITINAHKWNSLVNSIRLDFEKPSHVLFKRDISKTGGHRLEVWRNENRYLGKFSLKESLVLFIT